MWCAHCSATHFEEQTNTSSDKFICICFPQVGSLKYECVGKHTTGYSHYQLTSTEEPIDRGTFWSLPCTSPRGDSELIDHTSACVRVIHREVELWYVYIANGCQGKAVLIINVNTDVNTIRNVRVNCSYVQGRRSIPSETDNLLYCQICTCKVAQSSRCAYKRCSRLRSISTSAAL